MFFRSLFKEFSFGAVAGILITAIAASGCSREKERLAKTGEIAQEVKSTLAPAMMKKLFGIIKEEGYSAAVEVCAGTAEKVLPQKSAGFTEKFKAEGVSEVLIKRVSLKVRNPIDAPNELENKVLKEWQAKEAANPEGEKAALTTKRSGEHYYALLPIRIITPQCLKCHGQESDLDPAAAAKIKELYPNDQATGYKLGDLRGAFSVRVKFQ